MPVTYPVIFFVLKAIAFAGITFVAINVRTRFDCCFQVRKTGRCGARNPGFRLLSNRNAMAPFGVLNLRRHVSVTAGIQGERHNQD